MRADESPSLPDSLERIVDRTVAASALRGSERRRVETDLRAHLLDALATGIPISDIVRDFGDPELSGALIRRSPPRLSRGARGARVAAVLATALFVATYCVTAARFESFAPASHEGPAWLDSIATVARLAPLARRSLGSAPSGADINARLAAIALATDAARQAATFDEAFGRLVAADVARDVVRAAAELLDDPQLANSTRHALGSQLTSLAAAVLSPLDSRDVVDWLDQVVQRSFDSNGRLIATGLRVAQAMKGVRHASMKARLLEPILFVNAGEARGARLAVRRALSAADGPAQRGGLWATIVVGRAADGLAAQAEVTARLPQLIAITRR